MLAGLAAIAERSVADNGGSVRLLHRDLFQQGDHWRVGLRRTRPNQSSVKTVLDDRYLRAMYADAYGALAEVARTATPGPIVEIGAGDGLARHLGHRWWRSDVTMQGADLSFVADARSLPFADNSIGALVLKDALHHIDDVDAFLDEAVRVLLPGGVVTAFEPYWGPLARAVYRHLHQEPFDDKCSSWSFAATSPWDSNQAMAYLMLVRDRTRLTTRWPRLAVVPGRTMVGPSFLLSGGVSRRTMVSGRLLAALLRWEHRRGPWFDVFRFFHVVTLRKSHRDDEYPGRPVPVL